ncbi:MULTISPECIES: kinase [Corallincola]|uniref:kinase n=1 Tax=Corallincola TaxID=1775176 RepID=UPI00196A6123|nr:MULTISPECIES: kinase [Corallincola]
MPASPLWPDTPLTEERKQALLDKLTQPFNELCEQLQLPDSYRELLTQIYLPLGEWISRQRLLQGKLCYVFGVNGGQGSGKSTLCHFLKLVMEQGFDLRTVGFSVDDLYLSKRSRHVLARNQHPLLATRGVPGTHDVASGLELLNRLRTLRANEATYLPSFNKAVDDCDPMEAWQTCEGPVDLVIFEGWCVGTPAQSEASLAIPMNALEREEDADGQWRRYVNQQLAGPYQTLFARIDALLMLKVPDLNAVKQWRGQQEQQLQAKAGKQAGVMDEESLARFLMHYQRLTNHALKTLPDLADICFHLNESHGIDKVQINKMLC